MIVPLPAQPWLMQRKLLYTAVTRGRKLVVIVGTKKALAMAIRRAGTGRRYTALRDGLREMRGGAGDGCYPLSSQFDAGLLGD